MKKYAVFYLFSFVVIFTAGFIFAHQRESIMLEQGGFTGPGFVNGSGLGTATEATVRQAALLPDKNQVLLKGNIVHSIGKDRYFFRDATGDIIIEVKQNIWSGLTVCPSDEVEIFGQLKRDRKNWQMLHVEVQHMRIP